MATRSSRNLTFGALLPCLMGICLSACGGGGSDSPGTPQFTGVPPAPTSGTGRLVVTVLNPHGRPLANARVGLSRAGSDRRALTSSDGTASFGSLPGNVGIVVSHPVGETFEDATLVIAQQGDTELEIVMATKLPRPTVALMPVEIVAGSVSADRRELSLRVRLIASPKGPLNYFADGWGLMRSPYLGLSLDVSRSDTQRDCNVYFDAYEEPPLVCAKWGDPAHAVTITQFNWGTEDLAPLPADHGATPSTMLVLDQSQRMAEFTTGAARTFAARHLADRLSSAVGAPRSLAIAGFAGAGGGSGAATLPSLPAWLPRATGVAFSSDTLLFESGLSILEPLTGGSSPVFDALRFAVDVTSNEAPAGSRTLVALVSGDDQTGLTDSQRAAKLSALRQQHVDSDVQTLLIGAVDLDLATRAAIAELAEALSAPYIATGIVDLRYDDTTSADGLYAAMDLAADLLAGAPLPALSATFRVRAPVNASFAAGTTLRGVLFVETDVCPVGCQELPLPFSVRIP